MAERPWFETFFDAEYLRLYAPVLTEERTRQEVAFLSSVLGVPPGSSILDLACGQGRILLALAEQGYRMIGVDLSPTLLAKARVDAEAQELPVELVQADMRRFTLPAPVDAAICIFSAIGYFETDADDQVTFERVAAALRPGGSFLLDTANPLAVFRHYAAKDWVETPDGLRVLMQRSYDARSGRNREDWRVIHPDGTEEHRWFQVRLYTLPELAALLERAGYTIERVFGGTQREEYSLNSRRLIVLSRKGE
jgi:SAM-dependent methyltransferase